MAMSLGFLLVVFAALCGMAVVIAVLVMMFRAATRSNGQGPDQNRASGDPNGMVPPVIGDNSFTNPAHALHHSSPSVDEVTRHYSADVGPSAAAFDSGSAPSSMPDSSSASPSPDSGSGCG